MTRGSKYKITYWVPTNLTILTTSVTLEHALSSTKKCGQSLFCNLIQQNIEVLTSAPPSSGYFLSINDKPF